jgi:hypothetical protein
MDLGDVGISTRKVTLAPDLMAEPRPPLAPRRSIQNVIEKRPRRCPRRQTKGFGTKLPRRRRKSLETFNVPRLTGGFVR